MRYLPASLTPTLLALTLLVPLPAGAAAAVWRGELEALELASERNATEALQRLDELRKTYRTSKQQAALAYADSVECYIRLNAEPNKVAALAERALAALAGQHDSEAAIRLTLCRGYGLEQTGALNDARSDYESALLRARRLNLPMLEADSQGYLADLISYQGDLGTALALTRDGIRLLDQHKPKQPDEAWRKMRRGLMGRMANIYVRTDEPQKAIEYYTEVLAEDERLGNTQAIINGHYSLGRAYDESGQHDRAMQLYQRSMTLAEAFKDEISVAWAQRAIGALLVKQQQPREALALLTKALTVFEQLEDEEMVGQVRYFMGRAHAETGDLIKADIQLNSAIQTFRKNSNLRYLDLALNELATVSARRGRHEQAYEQLRQQQEVHQRLDRETRSKTAARLRVEFDTEKVEQQNRQLLTEQKFQQEQLAASQQIKQLQYIVIALVFIIAGTLLILMVRQVRASRRLRTVAMTDELTGIANRRSIYTWAERQWNGTRENDAEISLILIDIDHFKHINDEFGHPMGDHVLRQVAQCCQEQLRQMDKIGRVGGEEFMVVLPGAGPEATLRVAERLRDAVNSLPAHEWASGMHVTISLGVATRTNKADPLPALVQRADIALYQAKQNGRNRVEVAVTPATL